MDRMRVRTDLALEARESFDGSDTEVHGVVVEEEYEEALDLKITRVKIISRAGRQRDGKTGGYVPDNGSARDGCS